MRRNVESNSRARALARNEWKRQKKWSIRRSELLESETQCTWLPKRRQRTCSLCTNVRRLVCKVTNS